MRRSIIYIHLALLLLIFKTSEAQIGFSVTTKDVACNNSAFGSIKIMVNPVHPPYTYLWSNGETSNVVNDLPVGTYTVTITDAEGMDTTTTVSIQETQCEISPELFFTPNGDGIHDTWLILNAQYFPDAEVLVYNRLGQKVFEHKGLYEPWDGKDLLNVPLPDGAYFYIVYADKSDKGTIKKGSVSIVK